MRNRARIIELAALSRVPAIYGSGEWVESGGLASYGSDMVKARREAARYVDKILRGVKPSELPIEEAKTIDVVVNLRTARMLGLKIPEVVLIRATKVIE
jgi:putative ABC transport system substrate-binding protein